MLILRPKKNLYLVTYTFNFQVLFFPRTNFKYFFPQYGRAVFEREVEFSHFSIVSNRINQFFTMKSQSFLIDPMKEVDGRLVIS